MLSQMNNKGWNYKYVLKGLGKFSDAGPIMEY